MGRSCREFARKTGGRPHGVHVGGCARALPDRAPGRRLVHQVRGRGIWSLPERARGGAVRDRRRAPARRPRGTHRGAPPRRDRESIAHMDLRARPVSAVDRAGDGLTANDLAYVTWRTCTGAHDPVRRGRRSDLFDFELPPERIALRPVVPRDAARLLVVRPGATVELADHGVGDLPDLLAPGDALVVNDSKVIPA